MSRIYITGHKNPDMDSLCSAYAYASLKNQIDSKNEYVAVRIGSLTKSIQKFFEAIGAEAPQYKNHIYPTVKDVILEPSERIDANMPLTSLSKFYNEENPSSYPIYDGNEFIGLLTIDDIALWFMHSLEKHEKINAAPLIKDVLKMRDERFEATELFEDAKTVMTKSKLRGYPVYEENKYIGYVTRRCFLDAPKHNVILVDHNEASQSIKGLETANIVEILDHHRLGALKTILPIYMDIEPLGSTCTIVYQHYLKYNLKPNEVEAKMLLAGLISDTVILKSPTTTKTDVDTANELTKIANVNLNEFAEKMFSSMGGLTAEVANEKIEADFKIYAENGISVGIGQCEVITLRDLDSYKDAYLKTLDEVRLKNSLNWAMLMITDVIKETSVLLTTDFKLNKNIQYKKIEKNIYDMPGVLSRKKQLLPDVLSLINQ
ncbi:MAG: DHH family phosphoesterase [Lachnospiraceae bacterium]|nr:DHH family phosphoesterase [Lachnospiraceae bacterium]